MRKRQSSDEQMVRILREADTTFVAEVAKKHAISEHFGDDLLVEAARELQRALRGRGDNLRMVATCPGRALCCRA